MLYKNDLFEFKDSEYRMLHADIKREIVWAIALNGDRAFPMPLPLAAQMRLTGKPTSIGSTRLRPSTAMTEKRNESYERIHLLVNCVPDIYDAKTRGPLVAKRALELGCSKHTLYKDLRRWFQGGQTPDALLPKYYNSGRNDLGITMSRGRRPAAKMEVCLVDRSSRSDGTNTNENTNAPYEIYQLTETDLVKFRKHIESISKRERNAISTICVRLKQARFNVSWRIITPLPMVTVTRTSSRSDNVLPYVSLRDSCKPTTRWK